LFKIWTVWGGIKTTQMVFKILPEQQCKSQFLPVHP